MKKFVFLLAMIATCFASCDKADLLVSPQEIYSEAEGGEYEIQIFSTQFWSIETDVDWISFVKTEGSGDEIVSFTIAKATTTETTTGIITVKEEDQEATVKVVREGKDCNCGSK